MTLMIAAAVVLATPVHVQTVAVPAYAPSPGLSGGLSYYSSSHTGSGWSFWLNFGNPYPPRYIYYEPYPAYVAVPVYQPVVVVPTFYHYPVVVHKPKKPKKVYVYQPIYREVYYGHPYTGPWAYRYDDDDDYYAPRYLTVTNQPRVTTVQHPGKPRKTQFFAAETISARPWEERAIVRQSPAIVVTNPGKPAKAAKVADNRGIGQKPQIVGPKNAQIKPGQKQSKGITNSKGAPKAVQGKGNPSGVKQPQKGVISQGRAANAGQNGNKKAAPGASKSPKGTAGIQSSHGKAAKSSGPPAQKKGKGK
jgi:hypothetical protein